MVESVSAEKPQERNSQISRLEISRHVAEDVKTARWSLRQTEGEVVFRSWFDKIHWLILLATVCWCACMLVISRLVLIFPDASERFVSNVLSLIAATLSVIGSGLLLLSGFVHHIRGKHVPPSFHLVYAGAATDMGLALHFIVSSIIYLAGSTPNTAGCYVLSFIGQVVGQASATYTAFISFNLLMMLISPVGYARRQTEYFKYYHTIVWTVNIACWAIAALDGGVGLSVIDTCWMRGAWALVSVLMHVLTTAVILVLVVYCLVKVWEADQMKSTLYTLFKQCILLGTTYILVNCIHAWVTLQLVLIGHVPTWLAHMEAFSVPFIGFMNFLIWFGFVLRGLSMIGNDEEPNKNSSSGANPPTPGTPRASTTHLHTHPHSRTRNGSLGGSIDLCKQELPA